MTDIDRRLWVTYTSAMRNVPFTLRQLEVFSSLSKTRSFRRTAEDLGITQASVSSQLKTLEQQLGLELLDRSPGRRPNLRPEGIAFLADLRAFEKAASTLASHRRPSASEKTSSYRYKVLVGQGMFDTYIRRKLDQFYARHPMWRSNSKRNCRLANIMTW